MARKKLLTEGEVRQFMKLANLGPLSENYFEKNPLGEQEEEELAMGAPEEEAPPLPDEELGMEDEEGLEDLEGGEEENEELLARVVQAVADELGVEVDVEGAGEEGGEEELEVDAELEVPGGEEEIEMGAEEEEFPPANTMYQEGAGDEDEDEEEIDEGWAGDIGTVKPRQAKVRSKMGRRQTGGVGQRAKGAPQLSAKGADPTLGGGAGDVGADEDAFWANLGPEEKKKVVAQLREGHIVTEVARRVAARLTADKQKENIAEQLAQRIFNRLTTK